MHHSIIKCWQVSVLSLLSAAAMAVQIDDVPPYATNSVLHNLMLVVDDSGSMDYEMMTSALEGTLWWDITKRSFSDANGELIYATSGAENKFTMLFPNGFSFQYNGSRINSRNGVLPFLNAYAFARSADFNGIYYDTHVDYYPWPSRGGYSFTNAVPTATRYDPLFDRTVDLTQNISTVALGTDYAFSARKGMECNDNGANCSYDGILHLTYFPATYFVKRTSGGYRTGSVNGTQYSCAADKIDPKNYTDFLKQPSQFYAIDAFSPDGSCLDRIEIKPTTVAYPSGRSYAEEIQNFANWFSYHRRRHQLMRGAVANSLKGMNAFRAGIFWLNEHTSKVQMHNMNNESEADEFFKAHYEHIGTQSTPLRSSLQHAGQQYRRTDAQAPVVTSCQQNFTLLFTDGYADKESIIGITNEDAFAGDPYQDGMPGTLADIAYKYYKSPLRTDLNDGYKVQTSSACKNGTAKPWEDCAEYPHMTTFTVGLGATGNYFGESHLSVRDAYENPPTWPTNLNRRDRNQLDDLYHAAVNGRGEAYSAKSSEELERALKEAMTSISNGASKGNRVSFSAATADSKTLYSATYRSELWAGEISAYELTDGQPSSTAKWQASEQLDLRDFSQKPRRVLSYSNHLNRGVEFRADQIDRDLVLDLGTGPNGYDGNYQARIDYLLGDRSKEDSVFRRRQSLLGDIVHSAPVHVGKPALNYPDNLLFGSATDPYSKFKNSAVKDRTGVVYVGANDGMLHGFDADNGEELLAYVPSFLADAGAKTGLHYLTDPSYKHRYYVDAIPTVTDAYIASKVNGVKGVKQWRTLLAGATGFGGRGVFLLDITEPDNFAKNFAGSIAQWEFSYKDDANLGYMKGKPHIAMMNNGQWSMIFANGYNSATGKTSLFILPLENGMSDGWQRNDYIRIDLANSGGLSDISVVDTDRNGSADRIFAGDLEGNMWVINVSSPAAANWQTAYGTEFNPKPLFTARDVAGQLQAITAAPTISLNTNAGTNAKGSNLLVSFGTGQYLSVGDSLDTQPQSFYTIWDQGQPIENRNKLAQFNLQQKTTTREVSQQIIDWSKQYGWRLDLNAQAGERTVTQAKVRGGIVRFNTIIPENDPCKGGGDGWFMAVPLMGKSTAPQPLFDTNNDGQVTNGDENVEGIKSESGLLFQSAFLFDYMYTETSSGETDIRAVENLRSNFRLGRLSWRQLINEN